MSAENENNSENSERMELDRRSLLTRTFVGFTVLSIGKPARADGEVPPQQQPDCGEYFMGQLYSDGACGTVEQPSDASCGNSIVQGGPPGDQETAQDYGCTMTGSDNDCGLLIQEDPLRYHNDQDCNGLLESFDADCGKVGLEGTEHTDLSNETCPGPD